VTAGRGRKRYLLLSGERPVDGEGQKEITAMIFQRYPDLPKNRVVWVNGSVIVRTDNLRVEEMKETLSLRGGGVRLIPRRVSGSIGKLKKLAGR
jgi:hypothetical protein